MNYKDYHIILASNSPRRKELLRGLDIAFDVRVLPNIAETYPNTIAPSDVAAYISSEKADAYKDTITDNELVITADTVVIVDNEILGKPHNNAEAKQMLHKISGRQHQVVTAVCLTTTKKQRCFSVSTNVTFKQLTEEEVNYYVETYRPLDKAGGNPTLYAYVSDVNYWNDVLGLTAEVYKLVATKDGYYDVYEWGNDKPVGKTYLKEGDTWKIGETTNFRTRKDGTEIQNRYTKKWLRQEQFRI